VVEGGQGGNPREGEIPKREGNFGVR